MNVVVVESPAKARTINRYLGSDYTVLASYGHVRDLPSKDGSVRPDDDFAMIWDVDPRAAKRIADIADAAEGRRPADPRHRPRPRGRGDQLARAGGAEPPQGAEGRQGRARGLQRHHRSAVTEAMKHPREIDMELVDAYLARRALDYLVGFTLSPVLWRKLPGARSAGRVQSVALRLIVDREIEIEAFRTQEYWTVEADVSAGGDPFLARLVKHQRQAAGASSTSRNEAAADGRQGRGRGRPLQGRGGREEARHAARRRRPSPPRPCSRRPRASSASRPTAPCGGPEALRGRRHRRRDRGPHHLHAHRRRRSRAPEALARRARSSAGSTARDYVPESARHLPGQGQERPGGARGDPADQPRPQSRARCAWSPTSAGSTS